MNTNLFTEIEYAQQRKYNETACGDAFLSQRYRNTGRLLAVLSDGLGSGVKAGIMSAMTAKMALKFAEGEIDIIRSAEIMMNALPVCAVRRIGYATFTVVDYRDKHTLRIIEQGNPGFILIRAGRVIDLPSVSMQSRNVKHRKLCVTECEPRPGDRLIFFSDGVTEAGMGTRQYPLGWRRSGVQKFIEELLQQNPETSARHLAEAVVRTAVTKEPGRRAADDTTCAAIYLRNPRRTLILSGPPYHAKRDADYARMIAEFDGHTVICGGTSAGIVARELGRTLETPLVRHSRLPPMSRMEGVDLVTEGILTLTEAHRRLEQGYFAANDPAGRIAELLRESDIIDFVAGTRINEAHQDPNLPIDLDIRRNLLGRMKLILEQRYLKEVNISYI